MEPSIEQPSIQTAEGMVPGSTIVTGGASPGDGLQTRSFCYVDDLIDAMLAMTHTSAVETGPVILGNPTEFSVLKLAELIIDLTGSRSRFERRPLPVNAPRQRQPDITLARNALDWRRKVALCGGLPKTIDYIESQLEDSARVAQLVK